MEIFNSKELVDEANVLKKEITEKTQDEASAGASSAMIQLTEINILAHALERAQARGYSRSIKNAMDNLQTEAHETAKEKGWWDDGYIKTPLECHALMVSEIAEAMEAHREAPGVVLWANGGLTGIENTAASLHDANANCVDQNLKPWKPEGELVELADCVIRIMDYFGYRKQSLADFVALKMHYNRTRSLRHGGKAA